MCYITLTYHIVIATYSRLYSIDHDYETDYIGLFLPILKTVIFT